MKYLICIISIFTTICSVAQEMTQTIRGRIVDIDSKAPLIGATVILISDTSNFVGVTSDNLGYYRLDNVPIGKHTIKFSSLGYQPKIVGGIIVESAKENIINVELEESAIDLGEIEITATKNKGDALNEMALISSRAFSVEETERYAGSRGDPARMASNFAGVGGANDARNDIIVRGNSPLGVLWKLEGIDIPNPNHFAVAGSQGGPTSIINNKFLANSDFFTGAFPAEYGNSLSGVFDLKMRNGNNEKHEFSGQFGIFGTEIMAEGPISKEKKSSYLFTYRYSTITFFTKLGIDIGTNSDLWYQDAAFKLNFPTKNGANISVFGIGGLSDIDIVISEQKPDEREIYGQQDRDQYFGTGMGTIGTSYSKTLNQKSYFKVTLAQSMERQKSYHELVNYKKEYNADSTSFNYIVNDEGYYEFTGFTPVQTYFFKQSKTAISAFINTKINNKHTIKAGILSDYHIYNFTDSVYRFNSTQTWDVRWNAQDNAMLIQPYAQWKYKVNNKLTFNSGLHGQYYTLNNTHSLIEPRVGLKYDPNEKQSIKAAVGLHSQIQPTYTYFQQQMNNEGEFVQHNRNMEMTKSLHAIAGYNRNLKKNMRIMVETYYQYLFNVPVEVDSSSFSLLNQGVGFSRFYPDSLKNTGTGENYGIELTIEKFFSNKFFFMLTTSLYESFYTGSDGVTRDTDFNGNYIVNLLAAKEYTTKTKNNFTIGGKITYAGNKRYGPVDRAASEFEQDVVYDDKLRNTLQFNPYFRADLKLNYKINRIKVSHEIAIDLVNILDTQNVLKLSYAPDLEDPSAEPIREEYQLGRLPIFFYRINF